MSNPNIFDTQPETYQGKASPHNVMVKHINQVLAAEHRIMLEYQQEQAQIQAEREARHARERVEQANQPPTPIIITAPEDTDMNLKQLAATALTVGSLATTTVGMAGCDEHNPSHNSAGEKVVIGEEFRITKNPNPQHAYKLKVKIKDTPAGGFGDVWGSTSFRIDNIQECGYYLGGSFQGTVPGVEGGIEASFVKLSDTEYEGTYYIDGAVDGDFFGKGVCHWKMVTVGVGFSATGKDGETRFVIGFQDEELHDGAVEERFYFKDTYPIYQRLPNMSDSGMTSEIAKQHEPNKLFSITLTAEEIQ